MNLRTEKAIKAWLATPIEDREINSFRDGRVELAIWDQFLGEWQTLARFTVASVVAKRSPRRKKKAKK